MRPTPMHVALLAAAGLVASAMAVAHAQDLLDQLPLIDQGAEGTPEELALWRLVEADRLIEARGAAEALIEKRPRSYVGHLVLGWVQHYAEANFPKALYHHREALRLYEERHGTEPRPGDPWKWHARLLRELAQTHGDLEHFAERMRFISRYNELYQPDMLAERAWPLMKMGHYDEARAAAREGLSTGHARQEELALNALCAIEFEAGNDGASYDACRMALDYARTKGSVNAVDLTNFAEASRSVFKLDEAERVLLEATDAQVAWYGNPWMELAELYTRQGRYAEALDALRRVPVYRAQRPPHVRDADRNEARRALAAFLIVVGRAEEAVRITDKALVMPDRRAHNSRDPDQDRAVVALLDRRARLLQAERLIEDAAAEPVWGRVWAWSRAQWVRMEAWMSGRQAGRLLGDDERLVGTFRIGTAESAVMPPWLAGELVGVAGPAIVQEALARARARERRPGAEAYYDAFAAEAALAAGRPERAVELATRALEGLGHAEVLLRTRVLALAAEAEGRRGRSAQAAMFWQRAFDADPGVARRLGLALPVRLAGRGGPVDRAVVAALRRSPRLDVGDHGLEVQVAADAAGGRICLLGEGRQVLGCGEATAGADDDVDGLVGRLVRAFHADVFAPRVDMSQADINSLDGSNRVSRDPLRTVFDDHPPEDPRGDDGAPDLE
jgi:tetratricopeptide (TPR) repeat protein